MPDNSFRKQPAFTTHKAYGTNNGLQYVFPDPLIQQRAPDSTDLNYLLGQIWFDQPNAVFYQYAGDGVWQAIAVQGGSGTFSSLTVTGNSDLQGNVDVGLDLTVVGTADLQGNADVGADLTVVGTSTLSGDVILDTPATQIQMTGGAVTDFIGTVTLVAGTATVLNTNIAAGDHVLWSLTDINGSTAIGVQYQTTITPATSFVVTSLDATGVAEANDISILRYVIIREL